MKAATLIGVLPSHNFILADGTPIAKTKGLDNYYIPNTLKTKEMHEAFEKRSQYYQKYSDKPFQKIIGNNDWIMWVQNAYLLTSIEGTQYYKDDIGLYERAIFGALCGKREPLIGLAKTWHDHTWATFKSFFCNAVLKEFLNQRNAYPVIFTGTSSIQVLPTSTVLVFSDLFSLPVSSVLCSIKYRSRL